MPEFSWRLGVVADELLSGVPQRLSARALMESKRELLVSPHPGVSLVEFRLRPANSYYAQWQRPVPRPDNPSGLDATGLAVSLALCRTGASQAQAPTSYLAMEFEVWGAHERACFARLLRNHLYLAEMLVTRSGAALFTSCVLQNVEETQYVSNFEKQLLYFDNAEDPEHQFALQCRFSAQAREADIQHALRALLALYDAALGDCRPQPHRERLPDHVRTAMLPTPS